MNNHFAITLRRVLDENDMNQTDLAVKADLHRSLVSRLLHRDFRIKPENLKAVYSAFKKPADRGRLAAAYLMDAHEEIGKSDLVEIVVRDPRGKVIEKNPTDISPRIRTAVDYLGYAATDDKMLEDMLFNLARMRGLKAAA